MADNTAALSFLVFDGYGKLRSAIHFAQIDYGAAVVSDLDLVILFLLADGDSIRIICFDKQVLFSGLLTPYWI